MHPEKDRSTYILETFFGRAAHRLKMYSFFILKVVYVMPVILFSLWLLQLLYAPDVDLTHVFENRADQKQVHTALVQDEAVHREHFHMIDEYISQPAPNPPICLRCHGTYPHNKGEKIRSFLNFHTGFIACSVCHVRKKQEDKDIFFSWVDDKTRELRIKVFGEYGKYAAKIFSVQVNHKGLKEIFKPVDDSTIQQYLLLKDKASPDQVAAAKAKLHERLSKKPVSCADCHQKNGYLDFIELGFPLTRVNHLNSSEIVGMIEKYNIFYLPEVIDFSPKNTSKQ
jgi:hypothetical protein